MGRGTFALGALVSDYVSLFDRIRLDAGDEDDVSG